MRAQELLERDQETSELDSALARARSGIGQVIVDRESSYSLMHGLYWLCANLAAEQPQERLLAERGRHCETGMDDGGWEHVTRGSTNDALP